MIEIILLAVLVTLVAVAAYVVGRVDGTMKGVEETHRVYREEKARQNLELNKQIIDHAIRRKV